MIMRLLSKVAGPRVLLGVVLTGLAATGALYWQLTNAWEDKAQAEQSNRQLRQTVSEQSKDHAQLRAELDRRDQVVAEARRDRDALRARADNATQRLQEVLSDDTCANTRHPDAVTRGLQFGTGGTDQN